jgi:hypothetical protein
LSIRDGAFAKIFQTLGIVAHVLGDNRLHTIAASQCYCAIAGLAARCFHLSAGA